MYNKSWNAEILSTTAWTANEGNEKIVGMTVTAKLKTSSLSILDDICIEKKNIQVIKDLVQKSNPFNQDLSVAFSPREDLTFRLDLGKDMKLTKKAVACELKELCVSPNLVEGKLELTAKVKIPEVSSDFAGLVVTQLHKEAKIELHTDQMDMFEDGEEKKKKQG